MTRRRAAAPHAPRIAQDAPGWADAISNGSPVVPSLGSLLGRPGAKVLGVRLPAGVPVRARTTSPDAMNGTERRYADEFLETRRAAGEVLWWAFQAVKLRLADDTWFCPDFVVVLADGTLEFHEIKGGLI